jgi:hypothetical protein
MIIRPNNLKRFIPVFVFSLILISSTFSRGSGELFPGQNTNQAGNPGSEEFGLTRGELVRAIEEVERLISQYMNEAGFEYIANDFQTVRRDKAILSSVKLKKVTRPPYPNIVFRLPRFHRFPSGSPRRFWSMIPCWEKSSQLLSYA